VAGGDSGEFVISSWAMGIPHPPGYPLFTLLGKLFMLPFSSPAWAMNVMSGALDAAAAGLLVLAVAEWSEQLWAGVLAGGMFAFSPLIWHYAICAEVFPLNNLFVTLLLLLSVRYSRSRDPALIGWTALALGLGLSNHHTLIFCAIPLLSWFFWFSGWGPLRRFGIAKAAWFFMLGFSAYLYLPFAASRAPVFSWGHTTSLTGFFGHFLRRDYGTFQLGSSEWGERRASLDRLWHYLSDLPAETLWVGFVVGLLGVILLIWNWSRRVGDKKPFGRDERSVIAWTLGAFLVDRVVFNLLSNGRTDLPLHLGVAMRFWMQPDVFVFAWIGLGFARLFPVDRRSPGFYRGSVAAFVVAVVALQLGLNWTENDQHDNHAFHDWGTVILESLQPNAVLIVTDDITWSSTSYAQLIEGVRPDVRILNHEVLTYWWAPEIIEARYPDFRLPGKYYLAGKALGKIPFVFDPENYELAGAYSLLELIRAQYRKRPVYTVGNLKADDVPGIAKEFARVNAGLVDRFITPDDLAKADLRDWVAQAEKVMSRFDSVAIVRAPDESWEHYVYEVWSFQRASLNSLEKFIANRPRQEN
jgi:hypothetical protein